VGRSFRLSWLAKTALDDTQCCTRNQHDQAARIRGAVEAPFPMDLIVRTPKSLAWRLAERESFHTEIMTKGKVLYEKSDSGVGSPGGKRHPAGFMTAVQATAHQKSR
jgi:hypothetical protein